MTQTVTLKNGPCEAVLSTLGAEVMEWRINGRNLIWQGDARWWPRRAPVLFPICGWTNGSVLRARGRDYPCDVHSFGRDTDFRLEQTSASSVRFRLQDSAATLAQFPFSFDLTVDVSLSETGLAYQFDVANPGDDILPYAIGFHPGFLWPFDGGDKAEYRIEFAEDESPFVPRIAPGGLFTTEQLPVPLDGRTLNIYKALERHHDALVFRNALSQQVDFVAPSGRRITCRSTNFPHWVLWSRPSGDYLCIERWAGEGDPVGFTGDVMDKPGMTLLPPGDHRSYSFIADYI